MKNRILLFLFCMMMCVGCAGSQAPRPTEHFTLEYTSPTFEELIPLDEVMKVERFSTARAYSGTAVLYRTEPFSLNASYDRRWMVNPGDLATDYLVRDLRRTGLFRAVFSYGDPETGRYLLEGTVTEFFIDQQQANNPKAVLSVHMTLMDTSQNELPKRIVFQKQYSFSEPFGEREAAGPARGMSRSMQAFSVRLIGDIRDALKK